MPNVVTWLLAAANAWWLASCRECPSASAAAIAYSSAQIAMAQVDSVIPVDECIDAMGEIGQSMEDRYKETALGGLAATATAQKIAKRVLISDIEVIDPDQEDQ